MLKRGIKGPARSWSVQPTQLLLHWCQGSHCTLYSTPVYTTLYNTQVYITLFSTQRWTTLYSGEVYTTLYSAGVYTRGILVAMVMDPFS